MRDALVPSQPERRLWARSSEYQPICGHYTLDTLDHASRPCQESVHSTARNAGLSLELYLS